MLNTIQLYIGGMILNETTNTTIGGSYVRLSFTLQGTKSGKLTKVNEEFQQAFEEYWGDRKKYYNTNFNFEVAFLTDMSFGGENQRVVSGDLPVLGAAFVVMLVYLSLTLGKLNCIQARPLISMGSLLATICALIMGFGIGAGLGIEFNSTIILVPFILLGVGVDDDIIIVETLDRTPLPDNDPNKQDVRLADAMQHAGLSITLTSFSSIVAFGIGSFVDMPGITSFCSYASLSFAANYS